MQKQDFSTPMMKQYIDIKNQYQDCLLFYRMGDFYELFLDDALTGAKVLDITLTSRPKGKDGRIPMAGVPFHAVDSYLSKLVKAGYKVAICEQVSEPDRYGIVDREVIRIVTPGTVLDEKALEKKENNYVISLHIDKRSFAIATADISTGYFQVAEYPVSNFNQQLKDELTKLNAAECILSPGLYENKELLKVLKSQKDLNIYCFQDWEKYTDDAHHFLKKHFGIKTLDGFNLQDKEVSIIAAAALLGYLKHTQKDNIHHFRSISSIENTAHVHLDRSTIVNLELFSTIRDQEKQGSLISIIDKTITAMGGRLLRQWIRKPLNKKKDILERLESVDYFLNNAAVKEEIISTLKKINDVERILARLSVGIGNARDLVNLKLSLQHIVTVRNKLKQNPLILIGHIMSHINNEIDEVAKHIDTYILEEPNFDIKEGGIIKDGINTELDHLRKIIHKGKNWIIELEEEERQKTGITSLKIRFNQVFGFYIEISNANLDAVPNYYMRKQTLVNGERFITPELKKQEQIILSAEEKINKIEFQLFSEVLTKVLDHVSAIQNAANQIAVLDCILSFSVMAETTGYRKPNITENGEIKIKNGRHPVVEKLLDDSQFCPNDVVLNNTDQQLMMITGPNMAGKSVFIRQIALIVLMAQMGSFVPAESADISIVDRLFVRSGASDVITSGLSTFMVEMVETAQILNHTTSHSLIVMDEIGRGTSTYDGISIAWAVAEYLVTNPKVAAKTLFATHYHELQALGDKYPNKIKNFHMSVEETDGEPIFLHTILPGGASHSFGVAVAKLAGVPDKVIQKAKELLTALEQRNASAAEHISSSQKKDSPSINIAEHLLMKELEKIDISQMTPLQALNTLAELKDKLKLSKISNETFLKAD